MDTLWKLLKLSCLFVIECAMGISHYDSCDQMNSGISYERNSLIEIDFVINSSNSNFKN